MGTIHSCGIGDSSQLGLHLPSPSTSHKVILPPIINHEYCISLLGQTLKNAGLWLRTQVFTHGQLYVAMSRVGSPENLKLAVMKQKDGVLEAVRNVVFREVLLDDNDMND